MGSESSYNTGVTVSSSKRQMTFVESRAARVTRVSSPTSSTDDKLIGSLIKNRNVNLPRYRVM